MVERGKRLHKRRLRNLLLDARLQLHYVLWVTAISAAIALGLGLIIHQQSAYASDQILAGLGAAGMDWLDPQTREEVRQQLGQSDRSLVSTMLGIGIVLAFGLMAILLIMTHRIAGPLYRIARTLRELEGGRLPKPGSLRRGDHFRQLFASLCTVQQALRARAEKDVAAAEAVIEACERAGRRSAALDAALVELRELVVSRRASLES